MDTMGLFDRETSTKNITFVGSLSFLMSSLLIFNVKERVESIHLEEIYKFSEIARSIQEGSIQGVVPTGNKKEKLMFVVRDWEDEEECDFGLVGGKKYFDSILKASTNDENKEQPSPERLDEHTLMIKYLKSTYGDIDCMLLPHPGRQIKKKNLYLKKLDENFDELVLEMFEHIYVSKKKPFLPKIFQNKIQGNFLTCKELYHNLINHAKFLNDGVSVGIQNVLQGDLENQMRQLVLKNFENLQAEVLKRSKELWKNENDCTTVLDGFIKKLEVTFESQIPSHTLQCFQEEWKKEFHNLFMQIVNAIELSIRAEKTIWKTLEEFREWRCKRITNRHFLTEEEKVLGREKRLEEMETLKNQVSSTSKEFYEEEAKFGSGKNQDNKTKSSEAPFFDKEKTEFNREVRERVESQYAEHCLTHLNKILVEGPKDLNPERNLQFKLDLVLGGNANKPYKDLSNLINQAVVGKNQNLVLERFVGGYITSTFSLGEIVIPLYFHQ